MFYRHFCDILVETVKTLTISKRELNKRFRVKNPQLIQRFYDEKKSILLYGTHQGNWEWTVFLPLFVPHQMVAFYVPQTNRYFDELMKTIRTRFGLICVESDKGYKAIMELARKRALTMNYLIGDQSPLPVSSKTWVTFLNRKTAFFEGAERIARRTGQVVLFPDISKKRRGYYELEFQVITENPRYTDDNEITEKYAHLLEASIEKSPALWLWSHRRWKLSVKGRKATADST